MIRTWTHLEHSLYLTILLGLIITGCGSFQIDLERTSAPSITPSLPATSPIPEPSATLAPSPEPTITPFITQPALAVEGLLIRLEDVLYQAGANGELHQVSAHPDLLVSPEGDYGVYTAPSLQGDSDLWLVDLRTGEGSPLTLTPERNECCPQWWPARPGTIIFGSWGVNEQPGPTSGYLSLLTLEDGGYQVLDETGLMNSLPAGSPRGDLIAYDRGGYPYLYRLGTGSENFNFAPYSLFIGEQFNSGSPSWSPDGRYMSWVVSGGFQEIPAYRIAVVVFNLEDSSYTLIHPYEPAGRGGWPAAAQWSPDGDWLAFSVDPVSGSGKELWIASANGREEHFLGQASAAAWHPRVPRLAFSLTSGATPPWMVEAPAWQPLKTGLPAEAIIVGWRLPLP